MLDLLVAPFDVKEIFGNVISQWYYYLILIAAIGLFIVFAVFCKGRERNNLTPTQKLVYVAVFSALNAVVNTFSYFPVSYISISLVPTICFVAGYLLGAKGGFLVGFIGDLIAGIIFPSGVYSPIIGIANGLLGFIPGILFEYFKFNKYLITVLSAILTLIVCTSGLNTLGLWLIFGLGKKTFWAYLWVRLPWQLIVAFGNVVVCCLLTTLLPRILPRDKFFI